ncbi:MAG: hypothetical protein JWM57_4410, partial [Phycisphaerales bacterium]|nr:hypothetical protein [Phycisphaerales bacterium]
TDMYNVLEKLRAGESLTDKDRKVHEQGLVSVLKQIHEELDAAVFAAYGWPVDLTDEQILERLVTLNHERAEEEKRGIIRWLRPEFQNRQTVRQLDLIAGKTAKAGKAAKGEKPARPKKAAKIPWPKSLVEQAKAVRTVLAAGGTAMAAADVAKASSRANMDTIGELLKTLVSLG